MRRPYAIIAAFASTASGFATVPRRHKPLQHPLRAAPAEADAVTPEPTLRELAAFAGPAALHASASATAGTLARLLRGRASTGRAARGLCSSGAAARAARRDPRGGGAGASSAGESLPERVDRAMLREYLEAALAAFDAAAGTGASWPPFPAAAAS